MGEHHLLLAVQDLDEQLAVALAPAHEDVFDAQKVGVAEEEHLLQVHFKVLFGQRAANEVACRGDDLDLVLTAHLEGAQSAQDAREELLIVL